LFAIIAPSLFLKAQKSKDGNVIAIGNTKNTFTKPINEYNLTYTDFSEDSQGSLPIGNGDIGLNLWTEPNGDIIFYIGKSDSWSEAKIAELVKVGRVMISLSPIPFQANKNFSQSLKISNLVVTPNERKADIILADGSIP